MEDSSSWLLLGKEENIHQEPGGLRPRSSTVLQSRSLADRPGRTWTLEAWGMYVCGLGSPRYSGWGMEGTFCSGRWELLILPPC